MTKTIAYHLIVFCVIAVIGITIAIMVDLWTVDDGWWEGAWTGVRQLFLFAVWCVALVYQREITTWLKHPIPESEVNDDY